MRQIFSSPRLENVESVATLLTDAGIENKLSDGRSYKKYSRREFSYVPAKQESSGGIQPSVWVVKSDDYKRAREMLHQLGLLDDAKTTAPSYVPEPLQFKEQPKAPASQRIGRMRIALLFAVGAMAFYTVLRMLFLR
ncbi:hypothetical protein BH11PSE14_BH11PSE14_23700 [soil metagenome]